MKVAAIVAAIGAALFVILFVLPNDGPAEETEIRTDFRGLEAATLLLTGYDFEVTRTRVVPEPNDGDVFVMVGSFVSPTEAELVEYATQGGDIILVGDRRGMPGLGQAQFDVSASSGERGHCTIAELADTAEVFAPERARHFSIGPEDESCFGTSEFALIVKREFAEGSITWIGDDQIFLNESIAKQENAELLVRLVGDHESVVFGDDRTERGLGQSKPEQSQPPPPESSEKLFDLLPRWVVLGLWQLLGAFMIFVWLKSRRLGDPVEEDLPVNIPSAELARSTGRLFQRAGARGLTLSLLRRSFREECSAWVGLSVDANADSWVKAVQRSSRLTEHEIRQTLYTGGPINDVSLLHYSKKLDSLREECMR